MAARGRIALPTAISTESWFGARSGAGQMLVPSGAGQILVWCRSDAGPVLAWCWSEAGHTYRLAPTSYLSWAGRKAGLLSDGQSYAGQMSTQIALFLKQINKKFVTE